MVSFPSFVETPASSDVNHSLAHGLTCFVFQCQFAVDGGIAMLVAIWLVNCEVGESGTDEAGIYVSLPPSEFSRTFLSS
jgi:hypothetical protein